MELPIVLPQVMTTPERWVDDHGDALFGYAFTRLRDRARAQDLVQDTLLAAWRSRERFAGESSERTWLVGILRHKLLDFLRTASRERSFTDLEFYTDEEGETFGNLDFPGHWSAGSAPGAWRELGAGVDSPRFWDVFYACCARLPDRIAQAFILREVDELSTAEICRQTGVTESNLWVMLHRARLALRSCLEQNWIQKP